VTPTFRAILTALNTHHTTRKATTMTIAVDFDGVVHQYSRGWQDGTIYDPPMPGALGGLHVLMQQHAVFIFTTRDVGQVAEWLINHGFGCRTGYDGPFWNERGVLLITNRKLAATAYLDDRAVRFENWAQALAELGTTERPLSRYYSHEECGFGMASTSRCATASRSVRAANWSG
jgi:hypothetical protein